MEETKNQNDEFKEDLKIDFSVIEIKFKKNNQEFSLYDEYLYLNTIITKSVQIFIVKTRRFD